MTRLDGFLSSLSDSVHAYEVENNVGIQRDLVRTEEDRSRLGVVHAGIEQLLHEHDPFQFIKVKGNLIYGHRNGDFLDR